MSANHPTPWETREHRNILLIYDAKGRTIVPTDPETAKEIVAAMNATQGIGTKAMKDGVLDEVIAFVDGIGKNAGDLICSACGDSVEDCNMFENAFFPCTGKTARDLIARLAPKGE